MTLSAVTHSRRSASHGYSVAGKTKPKGRRNITLARPKTETTKVASPYTKNTQEYVDRVVDTLTTLYNRGDISQIQFGAGDRYRMAFEMTSASTGGVMDFDRVRGSGGPGSANLTYMMAAQYVREAKMEILYPRDFAVLHRVCVEGKSFEKVAAELTALDLGVKLDRQIVGYMFKSALNQLAAAWWPNDAPKIDVATQDAADVKPRMRVMGEKSVTTDATVVDKPTSVAHATRDKVYWSDKEKRRR